MRISDWSSDVCSSDLLELNKRIHKIDVIDDKTLVIHADRISFEYAAINDFRLLPAHIEEPIFDAAPEDYRKRTAYDTDPTNRGLYFGPYRVVEAVPGSRLVLERNETWWGQIGRAHVCTPVTNAHI